MIRELLHLLHLFLRNYILLV